MGINIVPETNVNPSEPLPHAENASSHD